MGAGGENEREQGHEADNVIRFPRNWVAKEDLVPFGPAADRLEAAKAADDAAAADETDDVSEALSADAFWGAATDHAVEALHQPVALPADGADVDSGPVDEDHASVISLRAPRPGLRVPGGLFSGQRAAAVVLVALVAGALGAFVLSRPHATAAGTRRAAAVSAAVKPAASHSMFVADETLVLTRARSDVAGATRSVARVTAAADRKAHAVEVRHRNNLAQEKREREAEQSQTAQTQLVSTSQGADDSSPVTSDEASAPASSTSDVSPSSSSASSGLAAGPTSVGTAVGCSPQCS